MALYFGYKKNVSNTEDLEKSISALKSGLATNNTKTQSLETLIFKKDGSVQMTGDLDLGDNSIIGIHDINADNSVSSKKYIKDELDKKLSLTGGTLVGNLSLTNGMVMLSGILNMAGQKIRYVATPTTDADCSNKKYVDDKVNPNTSNISSLGTRVTALENLRRTYTYHFDYLTLDTSWSYPTSNAASVPYHWMYCKGMTTKSRFHVHTLAYDTDSTLENNFTFTFKLDFFTAGGSHVAKEIFTAIRSDHVIPGERLMFIDKRFQPSTMVLTGGVIYTDFVMARLAVKGSSVKGNEFTISCSFEI